MEPIMQHSVNAVQVAFFPLLISVKILIHTLILCSFLLQFYTAFKNAQFVSGNQEVNK